MCPLFRELKMSPCFADERTCEPQITSDWQTPKSGVLLGDPVLVLWQRPSPPQIPCAVPRCGGGVVPLILLGGWRIEPGAPRTSFVYPTVPLRYYFHHRRCGEKIWIASIGSFLVGSQRHVKIHLECHFFCDTILIPHLTIFELLRVTI